MGRPAAAGAPAARVPAALDRDPLQRARRADRRRRGRLAGLRDPRQCVRPRPDRAGGVRADAGARAARRAARRPRVAPPDHGGRAGARDGRDERADLRQPRGRDAALALPGARDGHRVRDRDRQPAVARTARRARAARPDRERDGAPLDRLPDRGRRRPRARRFPLRTTPEIAYGTATGLLVVGLVCVLLLHVPRTAPSSEAPGSRASSPASASSAGRRSCSARSRSTSSPSSSAARSRSRPCSPARSSTSGP